MAARRRTQTRQGKAAVHVKKKTCKARQQLELIYACAVDTEPIGRRCERPPCWAGSWLCIKNGSTKGKFLVLRLEHLASHRGHLPLMPPTVWYCRLRVHQSPPSATCPCPPWGLGLSPSFRLSAFSLGGLDSSPASARRLLTATTLLRSLLWFSGCTHSQYIIWNDPTSKKKKKEEIECLFVGRPHSKSSISSGPWICSNKTNKNKATKADLSLVDWIKHM